jgi:hypothetical protein
MAHGASSAFTASAVFAASALLVALPAIRTRPRATPSA